MEHIDPGEIVAVREARRKLANDEVLSGQESLLIIKLGKVPGPEELAAFAAAEPTKS